MNLMEWAWAIDMGWFKNEVQRNLSWQDGNVLTTCQFEHLTQLAELDAQMFSKEQLTDEPESSTYIAAICKPHTVYETSRYLQFVHPTAQKSKHLNNIIKQCKLRNRSGITSALWRTNYCSQLSLSKLPLCEITTFRHSWVWNGSIGKNTVPISFSTGTVSHVP